MGSAMECEVNEIVKKIVLFLKPTLTFLFFECGFTFKV